MQLSIFPPLTQSQWPVFFFLLPHFKESAGKLNKPLVFGEILSGHGFGKLLCTQHNGGYLHRPGLYASEDKKKRGNLKFRYTNTRMTLQSSAGRRRPKNQPFFVCRETSHVRDAINIPCLFLVRRVTISPCGPLGLQDTGGGGGGESQEIEIKGSKRTLSAWLQGLAEERKIMRRERM